MCSLVIAVTGANRGIGFEIARQLNERGAQVVLGARNAKAGQAAVQRIGGRAQFHPLNVTNGDSVAAFRDYIAATFGLCDGLINNAGIIPENDADALAVAPEAMRAALETNALAPLRVAQALAPLLRRNERGRVVNVSSGMGAFGDLDAGNAAYRVSKTALNAVTAILAAELRRERVSVNAMCPGWVRTDMGGPGADRDVAAGADTAVWLALDAPQALTGSFLRDRRVIPW